MIDLIRQSAVPANVMRTAARGALNLPASEMIEILVYLSTSSIFGEQAKMTLAGWDEMAAFEVAANPATPWEVLNYMVSPQNLRPKLLPALLENASVRETVLVELAQKASREQIEMMMESERVNHSAHLLHALMSNPALKEEETARIHEALNSLGEETSRIQAYQEADGQIMTQYEIDHAAEIAAEEAEGKPFVLVGHDEEEGLEDLEQLEPVAPIEEGADPATEVEAKPPEQAAAAQAPVPETRQSPEPAAGKAPVADAKIKERLSSLQKIARMSVGQRIQLAMKGNKEERFILVRDGSKLVSQAVLQSPKITDSEIETFAGMKNVQEGVLREIARNHKFLKNYAVVRTLVNNPRFPLDLSLSLMQHLMVNDLKNLSMNKNVPETLRKMALKRFKDKTEKKGG